VILIDMRDGGVELVALDETGERIANELLRSDSDLELR
jgi:hypothetical protein